MAVPVRRAAAVIAMAAVGIVGCGSEGTDSSQVAARARAEASGPAAALGMTVWFTGFEHGELGVYLRPATAWSGSRYMDTLPATANLALKLARRHPSWGDVEVCEDATWLRHDKQHPFVPATRVTIKSADAKRLPAAFRNGGDVLRAVADRTIELLVLPRVSNSASYRRASAETVRTQ